MLPKYRIPAIMLALLVTAACGDDLASPTPAIYVNPGNVVFAAEAGGENPESQTVSVLNTGGGSLSGITMSITYPQGQPDGWLAASLNQSAAPATLTLTPTLGGLQDGTYNAIISFAAPGARNTPQTLNVAFNVAALEVTCVPEDDAFRCTFRYRPPAGAPAVTAIAVPGEFNSWNPGDAPMTEANGVWSRSYLLAAGEYQYKFHINGNWIGNMCNDPTWGHPARNNWVHTGATGCRGENAYIVVE